MSTTFDTNVLGSVLTNTNINFGLQSKPNIIIVMQNRNNFKIGLGNYLESELMLITCCK